MVEHYNIIVVFHSNGHTHFVSTRLTARYCTLLTGNLSVLLYRGSWIYVHSPSLESSCSIKVFGSKHCCLHFCEYYYFWRKFEMHVIDFTAPSWKCTPLNCSQHHFFAYTQIWHSWKCIPLEEKSWKIVNIFVLLKLKCTPQELSVLLTTGDAYFLHYLNEKCID